MWYVVLRGLELCGLLVAFYLPGLLADRLIPPRSRHPAYPHLTRFTVGILFWCAFLFTISALGLLRPSVVWGMLIALPTCAALIAYTRPPGSAPQPISPPPAGGRRRQSAAPAIAAVGLVLGALFVLALRPTLAWDADTYHLTVPRLYIEHGGFRPVPYNVYSNWPMNVELLFALGMLVHDYILAALIHFAFAVLIVVALIRLCRMEGRPWAGPVAACFFLANDVVLFEAGIAYVTVVLGFLFLMAMCFSIEADRAPEQRRRNLLLAGICCGLMGGAKLFGLFAVAGVLCVQAWDAWRNRHLRGAIVELMLYTALPCVLLTVPWFIKNAWYTGNPIYPLGFHLLGGVEWNDQIAAQFRTWMRAIGMGRSFRDYLLLPVRVILSGGPRYEQFGGEVARIWIVLVPAVIVVAWKDATVRRCALASLVFFVCWAVSSQQARFLLPVLPLLSAAAALSIYHVMTIRNGALWRRVLPGTISVAAGVYLLYSAASSISEGKMWLERYRFRPGDLRRYAVLPVYDFINDHLPGNARILFLNTNHGFFCAREYIADSFFEASQINALLLQPNRTVDELGATFRSQHITHILFGHRRWNIPYPPVLAELLADPRRARLLYRSPDRDLVYEIKEP